MFFKARNKSLNASADRVDTCSLKENYTEYVQNAPSANFAIGGKDDSVISNAQTSILLKAGLESQMKVLEIGCGTGRVLIGLSQHIKGGSYTGIDVVDECVEYTRARIVDLGLGENFKARKMSNYLDYPNEKYDCIFAFSVFTHMESEDIYQTLMELRSRLKPESFTLFTFLPLETAFGSALFIQESRYDLDKRYRRVRNTAFTMDTISEICKLAGYKIVDSYWQELENPTDTDGRLSTNQSWIKCAITENR
jgi:cyclopropane fatty-acyl-phospholipid synthase-like methyltransferase